MFFRRRTAAVGTPAPDFELLSHTGRRVSLAEFRGRKNVVLYFYPKDETRICTKQACTFRDRYEAFQQAGAEVIGVSGDGEGSHRGFADHWRLPFLLLSDPDGSVRARYGVTSFLGLFPGRQTFLIDRAGVVRWRFCAQLASEPHIRRALEALKAL